MKETWTQPILEQAENTVINAGVWDPEWKTQLSHDRLLTLKVYEVITGCFTSHQIGAGEDSESPLDCKEIKPLNHKGDQPWIFTGRTDTAAQYFGHLMQRDDSLEKTLMLGKIEGRRRGWQRMRWLDSITDSTDMISSKLWVIVEDRGASWLQSCGLQSWGHNLVTEQQQSWCNLLQRNRK